MSPAGESLKVGKEEMVQSSACNLAHPRALHWHITEICMWGLYPPGSLQHSPEGMRLM